jgi:hypothetical protein
VRGSVFFGLAGAVLAVGLAFFPLVSPEGPAPPLVPLAVAGVILYAAALLELWPEGMPLALSLLAVEYVASLYFRGSGLDLLAPAYASALFGCGELGWLALESARGQRPWPARLAWTGLLAGAGGLAGAGLLLLALVPLPGAWPLTLAGGAAAVAVAAGLASLARRASPTGQPRSDS